MSKTYTQQNKIKKLITYGHYELKRIFVNTNGRLILLHHCSHC